MTEDDGPPRLPGFREMAKRHADLDRERRDLLAALVARRRAAGLSQDEVAGRMGTSQPAVARLEAGQVDARMSTVQRYADAIGVRLRLGLTDGAIDPTRAKG
ncbi:helix-turn-helix domain-containing protein [Rhizomonospora bruguierae]|uniref:helix-turn-helix domain-containing protein n=1 Tax=Rhizomonospora bruguierae TaxID=1581705 RepID=UPI001BCDACFB|nr:helix-turn-helix transcriptional regulator [Micromonospora sp. NBRC 107566]